MIRRLSRMTNAPRRHGAQARFRALRRLHARSMRNARSARVAATASRRAFLAIAGAAVALALTVGAAVYLYHELASARADLESAERRIEQAEEQRTEATAKLAQRVRRELTALRTRARAEMRTFSASMRLADEDYKAATLERLEALERDVTRKLEGEMAEFRESLASRRQRDATIDEAFRKGFARAREAVLFIRVSYRVRMLQSGEEKELNVFGTGFLVSQQGVALTAQHVLFPWRYDRRLLASQMLGLVEVLEDSHTVTVWMAGSQVRAAGGEDSPFVPDSGYRSGDGHDDVRVLHVGRVKPRTEVVMTGAGPLQIEVPSLGSGDLVVLQLVDPGRNFPHLELVDGTEPAPLDEVLVVGYPLSRLQQGRAVPQVTSGRVRRAGSTVLELDAALHRGNSGGPVLNRDGEVVGLASAILDSPVYGIAVRGDDLRAGWRAARDAVAAEQRRLRALGCDPGVIDGIPGRRTAEARLCAERLASSSRSTPRLHAVP